MNKEIKFRAWDGKQMHYNVCINHEQKAIKYGYRATDWVQDADAGIPMQYTRLKDVNKAEVYEADLFEINDGLMEVGFIDGKFILMWADNGTYYCDLWGIVSYISKCGNKYENPELLKQIL